MLTVLAAGLVGGLANPAPAYAHEAPAGISLAWTSNRANELPVMLTNRGLVLPPGAEDGDAWRLLCNEAYEVSTSVVPYLHIDPSDKQLLVVTPSAVQKSADRGCSWHAAGEFADTPLGGFASTPDGARLLISTQSFEQANHLWTSDDAGDSWQRSTANPADDVHTSLLAGSSGRVYAAGQRVDRDAMALTPIWSRSDDAAESWQTVTAQAERRVVAIHPLQPDTVFFHEPRGNEPDALVRVDTNPALDPDTATATDELLELPELTAAAFSPDASHMWVGSDQSGGLWLSRDGGDSFEQIHKQVLEVDCLQFRKGRLWMCATRLPGGSGLWVSDDLGETFESVMTFDDVTEPLVCEDAEPGMCAVWWEEWRREVLQLEPILDAGVPDAGGETADAGGAGGAADAGDASDAANPADGDGGAPGVPGSKTSGCQLSTHSPNTGLASSLAVFVITLLFSRRKSAFRSARGQ